MRIKNSIKNICVSLISQIIMVFLGFLTRKLFLDSLGAEYLGVNGLLTSVISMLALAESGIGVSIVYKLYKPLAEKDEEKVTALIKLYKKFYGILAIVIAVLSVALYPLVFNIVNKDSNVKYVAVIYFIFILKNIVSYLNAHKWSLITADQKAYVITQSNLIFQIISTVMKLIVLVKTGDYILYLIIELIIFTAQNLFNGYIVDRRYSYIKNYKDAKLDQDTKADIWKNVRALFLHNIGSYCVFGTDNLIISIFISIKTVGLYSNYSMIVNQVNVLISQIIGGIEASIGNLIATESEEKNYEIFNVVYFINFWIYSVSVIALYILVEPFICWWIGSEYLLDNVTFIFVLINFYLLGMRASIGTFKTKAGIFVQDKYMPLLEAMINLVVSIILVRKIGLVGVFIGTTISTLSIVFWNVPRLTFKIVFKRNLMEYFKKYFIYIVLTLTAGGLTWFISNSIVTGYTFISLLFRGVICIIVPNIIYYSIFRKTKEFKYLKNVGMKFVKRKNIKEIDK